MNLRICSLEVRQNADIALVRQRARELAGLLRFGAQDQTRIAVAVSEVARESHSQASPVEIVFLVESQTKNPALLIQVSRPLGKNDARHAEPGPDLPGDRRDESALIAARRLMDDCLLEHTEVTNRIELRKFINTELDLRPAFLSDIQAKLAGSPNTNTLYELQVQNHELLQALAELRTRQEQLSSLTAELEDTNRGVVALYAELEEKAEALRRADDMKSRFLSNTSHELRTPLSSIQALSQLLLHRIDGELTPEQEKQVQFISSAAAGLSELVNDLLDLAKIEAGKVEVYPSTFQVSELFSTLRGILRPLCLDRAVELVFEDPSESYQLHTDEGKVSQIIRNFVANALKFTEQGEVRVRATAEDDGRALRLTVSDTGIGIQPEHLQLIFEEFAQVENPLQKRAKGTGLGLPLCRKLAALLDGRVDVTSEPGVGSAFSLILPCQLPDTPRPARTEDRSSSPEPEHSCASTATDTRHASGTRPPTSAVKVGLIHQSAPG